jgi:hypothetical protein
MPCLCHPPVKPEDDVEGVRNPAIHPTIVMAGLVPAIHGLFPKGIAIRTYPTIARTYRTIVTTSRTIFLFREL